MRNCILLLCLAAMVLLAGKAIAQEHARSQASDKSPADAPVSSAESQPADDNAAPQRPRNSQQARHAPKSEQSERAEGEQRFRENCGRCHQPPHKFPPRVMAAAIRHMRVRAMLTDEDMRLILKYMTQ